eukprot:gb/GECH01011421.1/.p1 GENE.gb/GECH01011421.1/~~gb/GECH01011421.1/.p1  ORF type:complete len:851 (+),score=162.09 gb/GECH01011421.1/:1-2553(+)
MSNNIFSISISEFDIDIGNTLSTTYPNIPLEDMYSDRTLADLCLPDGSHLYKEDISYMILPCPKDIKGALKMKKSKKKSKEIKMEFEKEKYLYGIILFHNRKDESVRRGAVQKSMLLLSYQPHFNVWEKFMKVALSKIMDGEKPEKILRALYETLNVKNLIKETSTQFLGSNISYKMTKLSEDHFGGASLKDLVLRFQEDTMILWYALLLQRKILFVGSPAKDVGNCCLACPLLVHPLVGFTPHITPYIALTFLDPLSNPHAINGATNMIFETKPEWSDFSASLSTGKVVQQSHSEELPQIKISSRDREFIRNILSGINDATRGETWVRVQFFKYTERLLDKRINEPQKLHRTHRKYLWSIEDKDIFQSYLCRQISNQSRELKMTPVDLLKEVAAEMETESKDEQQSAVKLFKINSMLKDISAVEEMCEANAVEVVSGWLAADNVQFRKYAATIMAQLSLSVKGQLAMLNIGALPTIVDMLEDPMYNVCVAASTCILKISSLYAGVVALLSYDVVDVAIRHILRGKNHDVKLNLTSALLNVYQFAQLRGLDIPETSGFVEQITASGDHKYCAQLAQLLDLWGEDLSGLVPKIYSETQSYVDQLASEDSNTALSASFQLLRQLPSTPAMQLQIIDCGVIPVLLNIQRTRRPEHNLTIRSFQLLAQIADSNNGAFQILKHQGVEKAVKDLSRPGTKHAPAYLLAVSRYIEVLCQRRVTTYQFVEVSGISAVVDLILCFYNRPFMANLVMSGVRSVHNLVRVIPDEHRHQFDLKGRLKPLAQLPMKTQEQIDREFYHYKPEDPSTPSTRSKVYGTRAQFVEESLRHHTVKHINVALAHVLSFINLDVKLPDSN